MEGEYIIDSVKINFLQSRLSWILVPEMAHADIYVESDVIERYQWDRDECGQGHFPYHDLSSRGRVSAYKFY